MCSTIFAMRPCRHSPEWPRSGCPDTRHRLAGSLKNLVARFLPLEEAVGARSTSYIVPCAWPLDHSLIAELVSRGHEVGVHGYDHGNLTPFAADRERRRRLDAARPFASDTVSPAIARRRSCELARCCAILARATCTTAAFRQPAACFRCRTTGVPPPVRSSSNRSPSCL